MAGKQGQLPMVEPCCVLVHGLDELASAVARMLLLAGHAVAMHEPSPPAVLRRKMAFSDAWYDGAAVLDGVEARRADCDPDLLVGLRSGTYIPVLNHPRIDVVGRWPWDVIVDARRAPEAKGKNRRSDAELTIVLGPGAAAGSDCDLVIETAGPDPGAVIRSGRAKAESHFGGRCKYPIVAPTNGMFQTRRVIGEAIATGDLLGLVDEMPILAAQSGRLRGLQRSPRSVRAGDAIAEIAERATAQVSGIDRTDQLIARSVEFAIELEQQGSSFSLAGVRW